jgi:hypothetical protein
MTFELSSHRVRGSCRVLLLLILNACTPRAQPAGPDLRRLIDEPSRTLHLVWVIGENDCLVCGAPSQFLRTVAESQSGSLITVLAIETDTLQVRAFLRSERIRANIHWFRRSDLVKSGLSSQLPYLRVSLKGAHMATVSTSTRRSETLLGSIIENLGVPMTRVLSATANSVAGRTGK